MKMPVTNLSILTLGEQIADTPPRRSAGATVCIESFTNEKALAPNLVGVLDSMLFPSASARKADELHRQRLAWVQPRRFSEDPLGDYHRFRLQEAQAIQERGLCRFVDDQHNMWLPTFAGALRIYVHMYWFMVSRRIYSDRWRLKRMVKRRGKQGDLS